MLRLILLIRFILGSILGCVFVSLLGCEAKTQFVPEKPIPPDSKSAQTNVKDFGDVMRTSDPLADHLGLLNDPILTAVTREFGYSTITASMIAEMNSPAQNYKSGVAKADLVPWSSWWFPKKEDTLFFESEGNDPLASTLVKYDFLNKRQNAGAVSAADFERASFNSNSAPWEGLCDAWALASISKPEPLRNVVMPVGRHGKTASFDVSDLKALLLKTYEAVDDASIKYYGQKFVGDYDGWIYPDMFPEQFHRFIEKQLFEKKKAFIMDHDAGLEVWNVPVFKANYIMTRMPNDPAEFYVRLWVYSAESVQSGEKSFVGTREAVREYNYVLQTTQETNGDLTARSGYWVKGPDGVDSRKEHPDYVLMIPDPEKLIRKSHNPGIDIQLVDEILSHAK